MDSPVLQPEAGSGVITWSALSNYLKSMSTKAGEELNSLEVEVEGGPLGVKDRRQQLEVLSEAVDTMGGKEDNHVWLLGINVSSKPKWLQLLICGGGFFFGYMINGVCEEYVYNRLQFSYGWYFTFVQGFVYLGLILWYGFRPKHIVNPWKTYVKLSGVLMGSQGLTKGSLMFLNYPAQIMFKSTKVLPVMVMGAFIPGLRRRYALYEYVSAIMLVVGLVIFTLADAKTSPNFSVWGVIMVSGALVLDAFLGNLQEAIFSMNPATSQMEMLFCSTAVGLPFLIPPMFLTGEIFVAWSNCLNHPYVYLVLIFEAFATFIGQLSVLSLIALFGAATTAMVTTARKAFTLLLSYIIFTKPLSEQHCTGLLLITMGIVLKMFPDQTANVARTIKGKTYAQIPREIVQEGVSAKRVHAKNEVGEDMP